MPGEQHGFGTLLVEEFFRRSGWTTWSAMPAAAPELIGLTAGRSFELVGLTVSLDRNVDALPGMIRAIRSTSRNPRVMVMVGGRVFSERPELAATVGADGTAADGLTAVSVAERFVALSVDTRSAVDKR
jgi:methanogenic corrinoid protein MtbC1